MSCTEVASFSLIMCQIFLFYIDHFDVRFWSLWFKSTSESLSAMTSPSVASVCSSCLGTPLFVSAFSVTPCCSCGNKHPLIGLAILALGRQWSTINNVSCYSHCDDYFSDGELQCWLTIIKSWPQLLSWAVPHIYSTWQLCLHCRPTSQQEITGLVGYLPCKVVFRTLHAFVCASDKQNYYFYSLRS